MDNSFLDAYKKAREQGSVPAAQPATDNNVPQNAPNTPLPSGLEPVEAHQTDIVPPPVIGEGIISATPPTAQPITAAQQDFETQQPEPNITPIIEAPHVSVQLTEAEAHKPIEDAVPSTEPQPAQSIQPADQIPNNAPQAPLADVSISALPPPPEPTPEIPVVIEPQAIGQNPTPALVTPDQSQQEAHAPQASHASQSAPLQASQPVPAVVSTPVVVPQTETASIANQASQTTPVSTIPVTQTPIVTESVTQPTQESYSTETKPVQSQAIEPGGAAGKKPYFHIDPSKKPTANTAAPPTSTGLLGGTNVAKPASKKGKRKILALATALIVTLSALGFAGWKMNIFNKNGAGVQLGAKTQIDQKARQQEQAENYISEIRNLIEVPQDENPTVASITDVNKMREQYPFFNKAKNGDILIIYSTKAILYDPIKKVIIDTAPVNLTQEATGSATPGQ